MRKETIILILMIGLAMSATGSTTADLYVSPSGSDRNPGTKDKPLATIAAARDTVRRMKKAEPGRSYRILLRGGDYRITETIVFSLDDSATDGKTITYAAYPGEKPVITPGVKVVGWKRTELAGGKIWSAPVPEGLITFRTLYANGKRLPRARSNGFKAPEKAGDWRSKDQYAFRFPRGEIKNWKNLDDIELVLITAAPWTMNILPLASVDEEGLTARTAVRGTYALTHPRFGHFKKTAWIENAIEFLDSPGEWAINTSEKRIYLWPEKDEPGDAINAPALTELVRVEGKIDYEGPQDTPVKGLVFEGITFAHGDRYSWEKDHQGWGVQHDWEMFDRPTAMVRLRGAENCVVRDCSFTTAGSAGIRLDLHCIKNKVSGNVMEHLGGVGIFLCGYGPGTKDVNRNNTVTGNHVHHIGELYWHSPGVFVWQSGSNLVGNNLIHNTPYSGIVVSGRIAWDRKGNGQCSRTMRWQEVDKALGKVEKWDWATREPFTHARRNRIFRNDIHDVIEVMTDGNGIYISGAGRENLVSENFVHDCPSQNFAEGIRCDDDQYDTTIDRNVIWRLGGLATFITIKGRNHVTGNIMACPLKPPRRGMLSLELIKGQSMTGTKIQRNIFYATHAGEKMCFQGRNYYGQTSWLRDGVTDYNLYFNSADPDWGSRHLAAEREHGSEKNSISADPLFENVEKGDFRLKPDSPAFKLGFEPIDMTKIGLQDTAE